MSNKDIFQNKDIRKSVIPSLANVICTINSAIAAGTISFAICFMCGIRYNTANLIFEKYCLHIYKANKVIKFIKTPLNTSFRCTKCHIVTYLNYLDRLAQKFPSSGSVVCNIYHALVIANCSAKQGTLLQNPEVTIKHYFKKEKRCAKIFTQKQSKLILKQCHIVV